MTESLTDTVKIHQALAAVMSAVRSVAKGDRNAAQGFNFRGIDATLNAVGPALRTHGVVVLPHLIDLSQETVEVGKNRTPMKSVTIQVEYSFIGPAGDRLTVVVPGEAMDSGDKAVSKAMSVALRTALLQTLALPTDEPDPDSEAYERAPATAAAPTRPAALVEAEQYLLGKVKEKGLDRADVATLFSGTHGYGIREETNPDELRSFADHLGSGNG